MRYVTVTPAYGLKYKNNAEVRASWENGDDFRVADYELSGYVNKNDKPDGVQITVRYGPNGTKLVNL